MTTSEKSIFVVTLMAVLGCGLIAGTFFAFSAFVMKAFGRLPALEGIAAMQAVNIAVLNPLFLTVFVGTTVLCGAAVVLSFLRWQEPGAVFRLIGGLFYVLGTFFVTGMGNVPLNDRLAVLNTTNPQAASVWADYLTQWTLWNHVRTVAALAAMALLILALCQRHPQP